MELARHCDHPECLARGRSEFCGFCGYHWALLDYFERSALKSHYLPDGTATPPIQQYLPVIERIRVRYPVKTRLGNLIWRLWLLGVTATILYLFWRIH